MAALFDPIHRRGEGIKWGLVSYTVVMFSLATVQTALNLDIQSISYIDNRAFSGEGVIEPGPLGYQVTIITDALDIVPTAVLVLSNCLADGLLVSSLFGIAFTCPTKLFLSSIVAVLSTPRTSGSSPSSASCTLALRVRLHELAATLKANVANIAMGTVVVYQTTQLLSSDWAIIPYFSISLSLNVLLTLMIVIRLTLYARSIRTPMGEIGSGGLCKAIVTMFIESCAINAVISVLVLGLIGANSPTSVIFVFILPETQVRSFP